MPDPVLSARSRVANLHRTPGATAAQIDGARRDLTAATCERAIQRALEAAPPLTAEQRSRLASLLTGGAQ